MIILYLWSSIEGGANDEFQEPVKILYAYTVVVLKALVKKNYIKSALLQLIPKSNLSYLLFMQHFIVSTIAHDLATASW
jgi:hypothetical protein